MYIYIYIYTGSSATRCSVPPPRSCPRGRCSCCSSGWCGAPRRSAPTTRWRRSAGSRSAGSRASRAAAGPRRCLGGRTRRTPCPPSSSSPSWAETTRAWTAWSRPSARPSSSSARCWSPPTSGSCPPWPRAPAGPPWRSSGPTAPWPPIRGG